MTSKPSPPITLFRGWDTPTLYVWSPFVTKLEFRLRLAGLKHKTAAGSSKEGPTGKIPYISISDEEEGGEKKVGDSSLISKYLIEHGMMQDLNEAAHLSPKDRALDAAVSAWMEEKLYFFNMRERWLTLDPPNFYVQRDHVLSSLPWPLRVLVGNKIYRTHATTLNGQGVGRFSDSEAKLLREEIWSQLNDLLLSSLQAQSQNQSESQSQSQSKSQAQKKLGKDEPFWVLGGENPTECDTTVFGFISSALVAESGPETREFVRGLEGVMEYARRIHLKWFGEYEIWET